MAVPPNLTEAGLAWEALSALVPKPVQPVHVAVDAAIGCWLAQDLIATTPVPLAAMALRDGWAVRAVETMGASPYSPALLPEAVWVGSGDPLPAGMDAVLEAFDVEGKATLRDAMSGEGVRVEGEDAPAGVTWRRQGERLRAADLPLLAALGAATVVVRRPKVALLALGHELVADPARETLGRFVSAIIRSEGAAIHALPPVADDAAQIASGLLAAVGDADLVLTLGGTGDGRGDQAGAGLAAAGRLLLHGLGARPGRTAGFGIVDGCPVIMLPGRAEDALAAWLLLAQPVLRQLSAARAEPNRRVRLSRKIASTVGIAELVLLRRGEPDLADPVATGSLPLLALAQADAALVVPAASEGYERGSWVEVLDMPGAPWSHP